MPAPIVAVIGGGQLARMMATEAIELGIHLRALVNGPDDPVAQVTPDFVVGKVDDLDALARLAQGADVITCEHELIPPESFDFLERYAPLRPHPSALLYAQQKIEMRAKMDALSLPSPRWREVHSPTDVADFLAEVSTPAVVKVSHGGYDGRGVELVKTVAEYQAWAADLSPSRRVLVEEAIQFDRELAVMGSRRPGGECRLWPVVESLQVAGQCAEVVAPAPNLPAPVAARAAEIAQTIAAKLEITGNFAVEMFLRGEDLLINELAMRPHNSGHWTQDGSVTSQFEQHLRAVLDLPLGDTAPVAPYTAMANVLGSNLPDPADARAQVLGADPGAKVHLYGKSNRPARKLGHVNVCSADAEDARTRARAGANALMGKA